MAPISFNEVPAQIRRPWVYVEFDNSKAVQGPQVMPYKVLMVGQKRSAGTQAALTPARITSAAQAATLFGAGSSLHAMAQAFFASNTYTEVWAVAFDDPGAGVAATGTLAFSGTITESGTLALYIAGRRVQVGITAGQASTAVATAVAAAINAVTDLPVTATVATSTVTLTHKHKGTFGNEVDVRLNYFDSEKTPAGLVMTPTAMSGGTGVPSFATLWPVLGDAHFNVWTMPYNDTATLTDVKAELLERAGPTQQIDAMAFIGKTGNFSTVTTFGDGQNNQFINCVPTQLGPTPPLELAAETAALAAGYAQRDPARPLQTLTYSWAKAPKLADRFTEQERNLCLYSGISALAVSPDGTVVIERLITMYRKNSFGADDPSYLDVETIFTLSYLRYDFRNYFLRKYPRHKLANDGTKFGAGQAIITPKIARAECVAKFREWEYIGLVENIEQFKKDLICERNVQDPNRLDIYLPPDLVNQLRVTAAQIGFRLQTVSIPE